MRRLQIAVFVLLLTALFFPNAGKLISTPETTLIKSDMIVVLGGDSGSRIKRGVELITAGYAAKIMVINPGPISSKLLESHILPAAILTESISRNSRDEAHNTLALMKQNNWQKVIVVSDPPHLRRLDLTWERVFRNSNCSYSLASSHPPWWDAGRWWRNRQSFNFVVSEYVKLCWYWFKV